MLSQRLALRRFFNYPTVRGRHSGFKLITQGRQSRAKNIFLLQPRSATLLGVIGAVFVAFLVIGMALPVLPLHIHEGLGFGALLVGVVTGSQFGAAILSRVWAGRQSDTRGPKCYDFKGQIEKCSGVNGPAAGVHRAQLN